MQTRDIRSPKMASPPETTALYLDQYQQGGCINVRGRYDCKKEEKQAGTTRRWRTKESWELLLNDALLRLSMRRVSSLPFERHRSYCVRYISDLLELDPKLHLHLVRLAQEGHGGGGEGVPTSEGGDRRSNTEQTAESVSLSLLCLCSSPALSFTMFQGFRDLLSKVEKRYAVRCGSLEFSIDFSSVSLRLDDIKIQPVNFEAPKFLKV